MLLPAAINYNDDTGNIDGFMESSIFDKYMRDQVTGVWLSIYADAIREDARNLSSLLNTRNLDFWISEFSLTEGGRLARLLFTTVAGIP
jgi:hypothetical protein